MELGGIARERRGIVGLRIIAAITRACCSWSAEHPAVGAQDVLTRAVVNVRRVVGAERVDVW